MTNINNTKETLSRRLGLWVLRERPQGILVALVAGVLPFMGWLSLAVLGLVTLRKGPKEGAWVLFWSTLPFVGLWFAGYSLAAGLYVVGNVVFWVAAWILEASAAWTMVLEAMLLLGLAGVVLVHVIYPGIQTWWWGVIEGYIRQLLSTMLSSAAASDEVSRLALEQALGATSPLRLWAKMATGNLVFSTVYINLMCLVLARWWQAMLFNPAGLGQELRSIRLSPLSLALLCGNVVLLLWVASVNVAYDMLPLVVGTYFFAGLSAIHSVLYARQAKPLWVVVFYGMLVASAKFFPYALLLPPVMGVLDTLVNVRRMGIIKR